MQNNRVIPRDKACFDVTFVYSDMGKREYTSSAQYDF